MQNAAIIINTRAAQKGSKGLALSEALKARTVNSKILLLNDFAQLPPFLATCLNDKTEHLFISSGDGTVQAIQTWLAENTKEQHLPYLCLLPHGTTNMTAADVGYTNRNISTQADFFATGAPTQFATRSTVRVANPSDAPAQHGMFFGTGAIAEATRYCQRVFNERGVRGTAATLSTLFLVIAKSILTKPNESDRDRLDRPHQITLSVGNEPLAEGQHLLFLATTLERLLFNSKPFWGDATAPVRITLLPYPRPNPLRWTWPLLYGGPHRKVPHGAISRSVNDCAVTCSTPFVIDGQFFQPPSHEPLRLERGPSFRFITA